MAPKSSFLEKIQRRFSCADYVALTRANRNYRLYVLSHMCQHAGDWFVRIASLISVQRITGGSATALSIVVMCRTIPELALAPFGGILADKFDRRNLMIKLDLLAALSVCLFIHAVKANSIHLLYLATVIRSIISATYMPITGAIVPQIIVSGKEDLKRAATLNGMIWSGMLVIGGVVAGRATARFGVELCYIIDILTYIISAVIMSGVSGNFLADADVEKPPQDTKGNEKETIAVKMFALLRTLYQLKKELILYLWYSGFGALIFLKSSGTLIWGAADILNVSFSHIENDEAESSRRMGALYSSIGIGCLIGPIVANSTIVDGKKPATLQLAILFGLAMLTIGWLGVASNASSFKLVCFFTAIRTTGSSLIWLFSTLLMQVRPIAFFVSVLHLLLLHVSTIFLINSIPPIRTLPAQKY